MHFVWSCFEYGKHINKAANSKRLSIFKGFKVYKRWFEIIINWKSTIWAHLNWLSSILFGFNVFKVMVWEWWPNEEHEWLDKIATAKSLHGIVYMGRLQNTFNPISCEQYQFSQAKPTCFCLILRLSDYGCDIRQPLSTNLLNTALGQAIPSTSAACSEEPSRLDSEPSRQNLTLLYLLLNETQVRTRLLQRYKKNASSYMTSVAQDMLCIPSGVFCSSELVRGNWAKLINALNAKRNTIFIVIETDIVPLACCRQ
jgi:hypothetical protein